MSYVTIEGRIDHGHIVALEPAKLPQSGRVLVTLIDGEPRRPDLTKIKSGLGSLKTDVDVVEWQRGIRSDWDRR